MIYVARDLVPAENVFDEEEAYYTIRQLDLAEMDYVIISYGLNDFFSGVSIYPKSYYEITNYVGALRHGIHKIQKHFPQLNIVLVSPTYTTLYEGEKEFEIGNYVEAARGVAAEMEVDFLDMFHGMGNSAESRSKYLRDGVHLTAEGREKYADAVIHFLEEMEV